MIYPKVQSAVNAALQAFSTQTGFDAASLKNELQTVFSSDKDFLGKVELLDQAFDDNPRTDVLREVFFDLLLINFFSADIKKLDEDYLESEEWAQIEEDTIDRGTELLNLLLYLNECEDEAIEPGLEDYLKEFLLVDEDEFQDEHRIYEPVIANQILMESPVSEIAKVAKSLPEDSELKEIFYPMMAYFHDIDPSAEAKKEVAGNAVNPEFDLPVYEILTNFK
ncbi:hypothetical protein EOD41_02335 [Mucilaginibacter limnophilus]|uniref:Uncharacterized protein n=1 Tax=Mucilaginibacter limnophilus TaxID=1932778 RepID=A0A437MYR5_9SPHI|nr:hypothetical protein [Mucilaginibacter limnophilus]RVU02797.1 hypothetical protein EOD41_02335 [Mucilaginibacter limnophilus]